MDGHKHTMENYVYRVATKELYNNINYTIKFARTHARTHTYTPRGNKSVMVQFHLHNNICTQACTYIDIHR